MILFLYKHYLVKIMLYLLSFEVNNLELYFLAYLILIFIVFYNFLVSEPN